MTNKIILYGIGDSYSAYRVLRYWIIYDDDISIRSIDHACLIMKAECPGIRRIYAMDNRRGLVRDYKDAVRLNSMEGWIIFKDMLEREGKLWALFKNN